MFESDICVGVLFCVCLIFVQLNNKNKEEKIAEDKEESTANKQTKIQVPTQSKLGDSKNKIGVPQSKTRSTSNNELKTAEKGATSQPSKKQGGMFDVVGNFSAISDYVPSVSSVTKSLTNASTNIDIIGASKLSKVVKFDMSSKVKYWYITNLFLVF